MKHVIVRLPVALAVILGLANCKSESPALTGPPKPPEAISFAPVQPIPNDYNDTWSFSNRETRAKQEADDGNTVKLQFQVGQDGKSVNALTEKDFRVRENGIEVKTFKVAGDVEKFEKVADIAFIVDITTSMAPFIHDAKERLREFIDNTQGYRVRMCLSTFGDYTVQHCDKFYDSGVPADVTAFKQRVSNLEAAGRGFDPGAPDIEENPFRALVDAAKVATWNPENQHFAILVTDAPFQYEGGANPHANNGDARFNAPRMAEVYQAIKPLNLQVFTVTKPLPGFVGEEFDGHPAIASTGEFFDFNKCRKTTGCLNTILRNILKSIHTTYEITYNVAQNGLSSELKGPQRVVEVTTPKGTVGEVQKSVSNPNGRPQYKQTFEVDKSPIQPDSVQPFINGKPVAKGEFNVAGGSVTFKQLPPPGAELRFEYQYADIAKNFNKVPLSIGRANATNTKVILNGKDARPADLRFEKKSDGTTVLNLNDSALSTDDYYRIRNNRGLKLRVLTNI